MMDLLANFGKQISIWPPILSNFFRLNSNYLAVGRQEVVQLLIEGEPLQPINTEDRSFRRLTQQLILIHSNELFGVEGE